MAKFAHKDFETNPGKYKLFKTATIAAQIFSHNGEKDLPEGKIVGIEYRSTVFNRLFCRHEPVYTIIGHDRDLFASTLADFVL